MVDGQLDGSPEQLLAEALGLGDRDDERVAAIVRELQGRGDEETMRAVSRLAASSMPEEQVLALDVIGQLGLERNDPYSPEPPWFQERFTAATAATTSTSPHVRAAGARALGGIGDRRCLAPLLSLLGDEDAAVRQAVAAGLPEAAGDPPDDRAVAGLLQLMTDPAPQVRNWATFGLGCQLRTVDGIGIRAAFWARIDDPDHDTRDEAVRALGIRRDRQLLPRVEAWLHDSDVLPGVIEAAEYLAEPTLLPALLRWRDALPDDRDIADAAAACDPGRQRRRLDRQRTLLELLEERTRDEHLDLRPTLRCDRGDPDVQLHVDCSNSSYDIDALLARAGGDVATAAQLVIDDARRS